MLRKYWAAAGRKPEQPGQCPWTQRAMLQLHQAVIEENRRQKANEYSLRDERGRTFSLAYWSPYHQKEFVLIPAGTPISAKNLVWAMDELIKSMESTDFGRYVGEDRERSMTDLRHMQEDIQKALEGGRTDG